MFICLHLDGKNKIQCIDLVSVGSLNQSIVHPREVFKTALLSNTAAVILVHQQRVSEVCGINTNEVDGHWWTLPPERTKNGLTHRVYLTDTAIQLLGTPTNSYYFLSPVTKTDAEDNPIYNHIDENAVAYAIRKNLKDYQPRRPIKGEKISMVQVPEEKKMELAHFTPHDLRRTLSTFLAQLGFHDEIIDAVTNHIKQGVIKIYNRYKYDAEKQQALEAWEQKLNSIITPPEKKDDAAATDAGTDQ